MHKMQNAHLFVIKRGVSKDYALFSATRLTLYRFRGFASLGCPRFAIYREVCEKY
jgi:hypothetical protein